jgi:hypothetical protein
LITVRRHRDDVALRLARILEEASPWPRIAIGWDDAEGFSVTDATVHSDGKV